ncbi:hypothetical protein [Motilimonas eburnea]|uniref:hypothetical protein n=1 Tax=Motilimonas eburnea TaxID=1737488 RepID=UPI001E511366|nr:hypothetical protein [Motilimonas eburnea]MCE2571856.1 hypothetical protein [Motilimonas eburnea]
MQSQKLAWLVDENDQQLSQKYVIESDDDFNTVEREAYTFTETQQLPVGIRLKGFGVYHYHCILGLCTSMFLYDSKKLRFRDSYIQSIHDRHNGEGVRVWH